MKYGMSGKKPAVHLGGDFHVGPTVEEKEEEKEEEGGGSRAGGERED